MDSPKKRSLFEDTAHADPATFSRVVMPSEILESGEQNIKKNSTKKSVSGEKFHEIKNNPRTQQFISRLLKPFFNMSDIVDINGVPHSYEALIANVERNSIGEILADIRLISFLTQDDDRDYEPEHDPDWTNVKYDDGKHMFYDFEDARRFWKPLDKGGFSDWFHEITFDVKKVVCRKLARMSEYFHSEMGRDQAEAAFKSTGQKINELFDLGNVGEEREYSFDGFYREFVDRIDTMNSIAHNKFGAD